MLNPQLSPTRSGGMAWFQARGHCMRAARYKGFFEAFLYHRDTEAQRMLFQDEERSFRRDRRKLIQSDSRFFELLSLCLCASVVSDFRSAYFTVTSTTLICGYSWFH